MFIAFEGPDGSGSSTQSKLLAKQLEKEGKAVLLTKEPTPKEPIGSLIREILQHKHEVSAEALQLLFCADRAQHLAIEVEPALNRDEFVITDRYLLSTLAYGSLNLPLEWLKKLNENFRQPDITFVFDLPVEVCLERIKSRGANFELFETKERLTKIQATYLDLAKKYPNVHVVNANRSIEEVQGEVWEVIKHNL